MYLVEVCVFVLLFGLPLFPGLREILRPRDRGRLMVQPDRQRTPRFLGNAMREKMSSVLERTGSVASVVPFLDRHGEHVRIDRTLSVQARDIGADVFIATDRLEIEPEAVALDAYGATSVVAGNGARVRTVLSDGNIQLGDGCTIGRWIDAGDALSVGKACDLGHSAAAGGRVVLGAGTRFRRVWGTPVVAGNAPDDEPQRSSHRSPEPGNVVSRGNLQIAGGRSIGGTVKTHADLTIGAGAYVKGNVIARGNVAIERDVRIDGHVFSEGSLTIGPRVRIGTLESRRTAYAAKGILFGPGAHIFGWLVSDAPGSIVQ